MKKVQVNDNIYCNEVISKTNVDTIGIEVYMWKQHKFETIFTSDVVMIFNIPMERDLGQRKEHTLWEYFFYEKNKQSTYNS